MILSFLKFTNTMHILSKKIGQLTVELDTHKKKDLNKVSLIQAFIWIVSESRADN